MNIINLLSFASTDQINLRHLYSKNGIRELVMKDCNKKNGLPKNYQIFLPKIYQNSPPPPPQDVLPESTPPPPQKNK